MTSERNEAKGLREGQMEELEGEFVGTERRGGGEEGQRIRHRRRLMILSN